MYKRPWKVFFIDLHKFVININYFAHSFTWVMSTRTCSQQMIPLEYRWAVTELNYCNLKKIACESSRHFVTSPLDFPRKAYEVWRKGAQKFHCDDTSLPKSGHGYYFLLVEDLCSDVSSSSNFCACSSDLIWRWIQWWRREMSAVFTGYFKDSNLCFLSISYAYTRYMEILLYCDLTI